MIIALPRGLAQPFARRIRRRWAAATARYHARREGKE